MRSVRPAIKPIVGFVSQLRQYEAKLLRPDVTPQEGGSLGAFVAEPALSSLEDEIGSLNSRIRSMTASAKRQSPVGDGPHAGAASVAAASGTSRARWAEPHYD